LQTQAGTPATAGKSAPEKARSGLLDIAFRALFKGLVYPQIWEDPDIDMEALALTPDSHVVAIASGGCNILSYLTADPRRITAVDLSRAHVALNRLKLLAARELPSWQAYYRFFGSADEAENIDLYWRFLAPRADAETRAYWEKRRSFGFGKPRIAIFADNAYRHGLLGRCIGLAHAVARIYGVDPKDILRVRTLDEQQTYFQSVLSPLFDKRFVRWACARPVSLYGLGIPRAQYAALAGGANMADVLRERVQRLACDFSLDDNYFAWQAFGRGYAADGDGPLPPYLRQANFDAVRTRADRVEVLNTTYTDYLASRPAQSLDRYVLLDAQDWMGDGDLNMLWSEITRTARPGARVIFRTAGEPSILPGRVADEVLGRWRYEAEASRDFTARDRSAIYGGFHLYMFEG
jgi:S-adenosylmethionine-diacylglycerol 3-amino-3-carboxypropyl transferase